ncbi:MAG: hypothetical protein ACHQF3_07270 [Alphaproteobacteria bacterium]
MKPAVIATLVLCATAASALAASQQGSEQFPAVTLGATQEARVTLANVRASSAGAPNAPCAVQVHFFLANGSGSGPVQNVNLAPGASAAVANAGSGLIRAVVTMADVSDRRRLCAVRSALEVFDKSSGNTLFSMPGEVCLGAGDCSAP